MACLIDDCIRDWKRAGLNSSVAVDSVIDSLQLLRKQIYEPDDRRENIQSED